MVIKNLFSKVWLKGQYEVFKYAVCLSRKSDDDIRAIVDHERGIRAWCSQRSYYLAALRHECRRRNLPYIQ